MFVMMTLLWGWSSACGAEEPTKSTSKATIEPFSQLAESFCVDCHGGDEREGDFSLGLLLENGKEPASLEHWQKVASVLKTGQMPPGDMPQPKEAQRKQLVLLIEKYLDSGEAGDGTMPKAVLRRLNRQAYRNTIRDLVGVDFKAADDFPADDLGYGFNNIGEVLSMPPLLLERYLDAAEQIVEETISADLTRIQQDKPTLVLRAMPSEQLKPTAAARQNIATFTRRAFRRPVEAAELDRLMKLFEQSHQSGRDFPQSVGLVMQAVLISPHFLFQLEVDPAGDDVSSVRALSDFELATRLSYFLWNSMPDEALYQAAKKGTLQNEEELSQQVQRMLKDPRATKSYEQFSMQWLQLQALEVYDPNHKRFPEFKRDLRHAMLEESRQMFRHVYAENHDVLELLRADYTFANARLAKHYGIEGVKGKAFRKISLEGTPRVGVLTHGSVLTMTSNPSRTSPVKRGKWVLENMLATPLPAPPPDVDAGALGRRDKKDMTLRERLERHRADASCAGCHNRMDPLGLALEHFNAIGAWRAKDRKMEIDARGELPDGKKFEGAKQLRDLLLSEYKEDFRRCFTEKMLTYALGRGVEVSDRPAVRKVLDSAAANEDRVQAYILAIVLSDPFRKRSTRE